MIILSRSKNPSHQLLMRKFRQAVPMGGTVFYPWLRGANGSIKRVFLIVAATERLHLRLVHTIERDPK